MPYVERACHSIRMTQRRKKQYSPVMKQNINKVFDRTGMKWNLVNANDNAKVMEVIQRQDGRATSYLQHANYDNQRIMTCFSMKIAHDVAIVYADEPYIMAVMSKN